MAVYSDEAIVIRNYKLGEADKIIVMFTLGRGKVRAVAKGVRRTKSKFGSRLEPGSMVKIQLYEGKNLDTITQVERKYLLTNQRSDLTLYSRYALMLETLDRFTEDGEKNPAMYKLASKALMEFDKNSNPLVVSAFVAKMLTLEGIQPRIDSCVSCNSETDLVAFQLSEGGVTCKDCRRGQYVSPEVLQALQRVFEGKVREMLDSTPENVMFELEAITTQMVEQHTEKRLKSKVSF